MILSAIAFCKRVTCPSSEALLDYGTRGLAAEQMDWVGSHLEECDFCNAELRLLTDYAPAAEEEESPFVEMPSNLRRLAQSLLASDLLSIEYLADAACEKERLTLTDA